MAVLRSKKVTGCSSSSSSNSTDVSDPSHDGSKRLRSRVLPPRKRICRNPHKIVRPYATNAINAYNKKRGTNYELVQPGRMQSVLFATCFLHHIDFTAKEADVADAPEEMFFAELTSTVRDSFVKFCTRMGPKNSISGDKNNGCCYCWSYSVQHPRGGGFMADRGQFTDDSDPSLDGSKCLPPTVDPVSPKAEPRKECEYTSEDPHEEVRPYATDAISLYNERTGKKYELVQTGFMEHTLLAPFILHHIDFTAKKTDFADALEEMFFAELTSINGFRTVKLCRCMGPKYSISGDKHNGCCYCTSYLVQHPRGGGFMAGRAGLFKTEL